MSLKKKIKRRPETLRRTAALVVAGACAGVVLGAGSARADEEATTSSEVQACTEEALTKPEFNADKAATMNEPGNRESQYLFTVARLHKASAECLSIVKREGPRVFFKMQRPGNHKAWIRSKAQEMVIREGSAAIPRLIEGRAGRGEAAILASRAGRGLEEPLTLGEVVDSKFIYKCTPGKSVTHVKVVFVMTARSAVNGSVLGEHSYAAPVKIIHAIPGEPLLHGAVFRAC